MLLAKFIVKTINTLLYVPLMRQHIVCLCVCCTSMQAVQHIGIEKTCCRITETYTVVINF